MTSEDRILAIVRRIAKNDVDPGSDESLFESGVLDSFALPEMVSELEKEFHIQVPDADLVPRKFETLGRISEYVRARAS